MNLSLIIKNLNWTTLPDLILVYLLIYTFLVWSKTTRSYQLIKGLIIIFIVYFLSFFLQLNTLNWLLGKFTTVLLLLVIILFQPEIRRILERLGRGQLFSPLLAEEIQSIVVIKQILKSVDLLSKQKIGAIIVIEVSSNLSEYIESGVPVDAPISADLLLTLFWPLTPTHDGAVIIRENRITAAGCLLPLTEKKVTDRRLGTRHRAAIGLSEETDAVVMVVSEETGIISLAEKGNLTRFLTKEALETRLFNLYSEDEKTFSFRHFFNVLRGKKYHPK